MHPSFSAWSLVVWLAVFIVPTLADNTTTPASDYHSRLDLKAPFLEVTHHEDDLISPGYIFLAPYQLNQPGPYIYDNRGNLIWSGFGVAGPGPIHDFRVCEYDGSPHLCYFTGFQHNGYASGHGAIVDSSFRTVTSVQSQGNLDPSDMHEFNVINGGESALLTVISPAMYDLSEFGIGGGQGYVMNCFAQEVEVATGRVLWQWSALDHVDPSVSYVPPNSTGISGDGLTKDSPWDYFHLNAIDKDEDGNYLLSARHVSSIYKVSGENGSIIWQLGGMNSDFTIAGFSFSFQHDARFISENASTVVISLFDNGSDHYHVNAEWSSGMIVKLDKANKVATLLRRYRGPDDILSGSQGNTQILPNGNVFCGWGNEAWVSEHTAEGDLIFAATFATTDAMNYRAYKFNFTTHPIDSPTASAYALDSSSPTIYWMSWNGATEATQWRIYTSPDPTQSPFSLLTTTPREGFETRFEAPGYHAWAIVEAVAENGTGLRNTSTYIETFVPSQQLASSCDEEQCALATSYDSPPGVMTGAASGSPTVSTIPIPSLTIMAAIEESGSASASASRTSGATSSSGASGSSRANDENQAAVDVSVKWMSLVWGVSFVMGGLWFL